MAEETIGIQGTELSALIDDVKCFVARPEFRIKLDDLIVAEVRRLDEQLRTQDFSMGSMVEGSEFSRRVLTYEQATVRMAKVLGVLGRWGEEAEFRSALDAILYVYARNTEPISGYETWLSLRSYPAVLLFTSYGLSLTRAEHWSALHRFLSYPAPDGENDGEASNLVESLFGPAWDGGDVRLWRMLDGVSDHRTPLSDHVFEVLSEWSRDYIGIVADVEGLYDLWEILASLSFSERYGLASLEADDRVDRTWIPLGRNAWRTRSRREVLHRIRGNEVALLEAGFCNGESTFLDAAIKSLSAWADRSNWW